MSMQQPAGDAIGEVGGFVTPRFAFGISPASHQCISFLGGRRLLHSVGRHLVVRDGCASDEVQFVASEEHTLRILAVAVASNKKYIACVEQSSSCSPGQVSVYSVQHMKRVKTLPLDKAAAKSKDNPVVDISFSASAKLLAVQKGAPEWEVQIWRWYSGKLVACGRADQEVSRLECNPWEELQLTVVGGSHARAMRIDVELEQVKTTSLMNEADGELRGLLYLPGGLFALTVGGDGVNVYSSGFKLEQQLCKWDDADPHAALTRKGRGLISSTASGNLQLWDIADREDKPLNSEQLLFRCSKTLAVPLGPQHKVLGLAASDGEEEIAVVASGGQLLLLNTEELAAEEEQPIRSLLMPQDPDLGMWKLVGGGFHEGAVVGLDAAVQQPWVVSAGEDKTVRVWSWPQRTCMASAMMPDDIVSCAIHPSGMMVLIGMVNKLRLAYVLNGDLETAAELPIKKALALKFSHGGHLFAAAGRTNHIEILSTYTQQRLSPGTGMKGHVSTVTGISFAASDRWLVSVGAGGAVYFWDLTTYARVVELEHVDKKCIYHGAAFYNKSPGAVVRTYDGRIQQIMAGALQYELQPGGSEYAPVMLVGEDRILLVASTSGVVTAMGWPQEFPLQPGCSLDHRPQQARLHGASINAMAYLPASALSGLLFTAGADGVILVSQVSLVLDARAEDLPDDAASSSLLLYRSADVEAMKDRIRDLALQFTHIKSAAEYQTMRREAELKEQIQGLEHQLASLTVLLDQKAAELEATRIAAMEHEEAVVRELELAHSRLAEEVEALWEQRLQLERLTMNAQDAQAADTLLQAQEKLQRQHALHQKELARMKADWSSDVAAEKSRLAALAVAKAEQEEFFEEMVTQTEQDFEAHATVMERRQEAWAASTEEERMRMKADNHLLKKTNIRLKGQKAQDLKRIELLSSENVETRTTLQDRELTIKKLNAEIEERDAVISSNYHTIQQIRRRMQDLEKHKFVLGYKADAYQKELHPKQEAVRKLEGELEEHDKQLVAGLTAMRDLQAEVQEKEGYIRSLKHEILDAKNRNAEQSIMLNSFSTDLFQAMQEPDDRTPSGKSRRQEALQVLYNKYCFNSSRKTGPTDVEAELQRHLQLLEMKGTLLERRVQLAQHQGQSAVQQKQHQNSMLLHDMAELVQHNRQLGARLNEVQCELSAAHQRYRLVHQFVEAHGKDGSNAPLAALLEELQAVKPEARAPSPERGQGRLALGGAAAARPQSARPQPKHDRAAATTARPQSARPSTALSAHRPRSHLHAPGLGAPDSCQLLAAHEQRRMRELSGRLASSSSGMQVRLRAAKGDSQGAAPAGDA